MPMCVLYFARNLHSDYPVIAAFNRDEYFDRPAVQLDFWPDCPQILAGKDIPSNGTWAGVSTEGRYAFLTNYRDPARFRKDARSRGEIVPNFLKSKLQAVDFLEAQVIPYKYEFNLFNLILGDIKETYYYSNVTNEIRLLGKGLYSVSNHLLDTEWKKVKRGKEQVQKYLSGNQKIEIEPFLDILANKELAMESELPRTGVSMEFEKILSAIFVESPEYGTRVSSVLAINSKNEIEFLEKTYQPPVKHRIKHFKVPNC